MKSYSLKIFAAVFVLMQFSFCYEITGKVIGITDGDTIELLNGKKSVKIRLDGIDSPEKRQDFGQKAKEFTSSLCFGKTVRVSVSENDRYGRLIAKVFLPEGNVLNEEVLKAGFAWHFKKYNAEKRLADMEVQARAKRIGLWAGRDPVAPWDFRNSVYPNGPAVPVTGNFTASAGSGKFHTLKCEWGRKISINNRLYFKTRDDALKQGYKPCKSCKP